MKQPKNINQMSSSEWEMLPITFNANDMSRVCGRCVRYIQNHAEELGGHKVGGRWLFSKPAVAELLGLTA